MARLVQTLLRAIPYRYAQRFGPDELNAPAVGSCQREPADVAAVAVFLRGDVTVHEFFGRAAVKSQKGAFAAVRIVFLRTFSEIGDSLQRVGDAGLQSDAQRLRHPVGDVELVIHGQGPCAVEGIGQRQPDAVGYRLLDGDRTRRFVDSYGDGLQSFGGFFPASCDFPDAPAAPVVVGGGAPEIGAQRGAYQFASAHRVRDDVPAAAGDLDI